MSVLNRETAKPNTTLDTDAQSTCFEVRSDPGSEASEEEIDAVASWWSSTLSAYDRAQSGGQSASCTQNKAMEGIITGLMENPRGQLGIFKGTREAWRAQILYEKLITLNEVMAQSLCEKNPFSHTITRDKSRTSVIMEKVQTAFNAPGESVYYTFNPNPSSEPQPNWPFYSRPQKDDMAESNAMFGSNDKPKKSSGPYYLPTWRSMSDSPDDYDKVKAHVEAVDHPIITLGPGLTASVIWSRPSQSLSAEEDALIDFK